MGFQSFEARKAPLNRHRWLRIIFSTCRLLSSVVGRGGSVVARGGSVIGLEHLWLVKSRIEVLRSEDVPID
jgi:hypothetical protein